jgi:hypothetical protein
VPTVGTHRVEVRSPPPSVRPLGDDAPAFCLLFGVHPGCVAGRVEPARVPRHFPGPVVDAAVEVEDQHADVDREVL